MIPRSTSEPCQFVKVTTAACAVLQIRLKKIGRARARTIAKLSEESLGALASLSGARSQNFEAESLVACENPAGQCRRESREVLSHRTNLISLVPHLMADLEPGVPKRIEQRLHEGLEARRGSVAHDQQIEIRRG